MLNVRIAWLLFLVCAIPVAGFTDTIATREGITHTGTLVQITGEYIVLQRGQQSAVFMRSAVLEVTFDVSDVVALISGDTLHGKVLRTGDSTLVVALEGGIRVLPVASIASIAHSAGSVLRVRDLSETDGSFHPEEVKARSGRTAVSFSMSVGSQNTVYTFGGSPPQWGLRPAEPAIEKQFKGALYAMEAGFDIDANVSASLGILLYTGEAHSAGSPELREVGYFCFYASGMYSAFPQSGLDVYLRLQVGIQRGRWKLWGNVNRTASSPTTSIVPGVGVKYRLFPLLQVYCECNRHLVSLPLSERGESLDTRGFVFSLGLRLYVPAAGQ